MELINRSSLLSSTLSSTLSSLSLSSLPLSSISTPSTKQMNINDLDNYSLLTIFDLLNIEEISICSLINRRWYLITKNLINLKKKNLALFFGLNEYNRINRRIDKSIKSFEPLFIDNNQLLSELNLSKLILIEKLKFITNQNYKFDSTFNFNQLPNLKYLETNDNQLCELILIESRLNNFKFVNIEYLNLNYCSLDVIINSFPNLNYLELDYLNLDYFESNKSNQLKLNYLIIKEDKLTTKLIDYLIKNCLNLKYLEIKLNDSFILTHLDRLLKELNWCMELNLFTQLDDCLELNKIIKLNSQRFKNINFKLFINLIRVKLELNLESIYPLTIKGCFNIYELKKLINDKRINKDEYLNRIRSITIIDNKQIDKFEQFYLKLINLDELIIYENPTIHQFNLTIDRLNKLPKTIKKLCLKFNYELPQSILDNLPTLFPNLIKLTLQHLGNKEYNLEFIKKFKFINQLCLIDLSSLNSIHLIDLFLNCKFLSKLEINYLEKKTSFDKTKLIEQIELNKIQNSSLKYEIDL